MGRVEVAPELLRWARERAGLNVADLQAKFPKLGSWERQEKRPTLRQVEAYARATRTPLGYLFLTEPPDERLSVPDFRTRRPDGALARPSPDLLDTIQAMQRRQGWLRDYLEDEGQPSLAFVGSARLRDDPADVATRIRRALALDDAWAQRQPTWTDALRTLRDAAESVGIVVTTNGVVGNNTHRKLNPDEFSGFVLVDDLAPFVFVNGADWKAAQMFTLAHELAHVWFGQSAVFDLHELQAPAEDVERACDHVAAELLVPEVALRELWPTARRGAEPFQVVARHFKVSSLVAARRALDLTLVTRDQFFEFYRAYEQDERRRSAAAVAAGRSGGDFYLTQNVRLGRRFAYAVAHAVREGRLLYRDAYHLVGFAGGTFDRFITEISASRRGVM